ncbi:unnamed protein product [Moneuplotes crassus]|uniref:Uncharacterized protein n=1 Tax=Euplotes crassus TaxID=5936 RepID=A0AAD1XL29_EUPCR|nr:unnamed protein product [Moneuplotes crassus]
MKTGTDDPYMTFYPKDKQTNPRRPKQNHRNHRKNLMQEDNPGCDPVPVHPRTIRIRNKTTEYTNRQIARDPKEIHHQSQMLNSRQDHQAIKYYNTERKELSNLSKILKKPRASYNDFKIFEDQELKAPPVKIRSQLKRLMKFKLKEQKKSRETNNLGINEPIINRSNTTALVVLSNRSMIKYPRISKRGSKESFQIYRNISDNKLSFKKMHKRSASHSGNLTLLDPRAKSFSLSKRNHNPKGIVNISSFYHRGPEKQFKMRLLAQKLNTWIRVKNNS